MMHYYKVSAEHIRRLDIGRAADDMQTELHVIVMTAGRDEVFDRQGIWIVASEKKLGNQLQDIVWRYNSGHWCAVTELAEELAESYC
jgi:hypothetical protein